MSIRLLRDEDNVFTIDFAAQQLTETARSLHSLEALADPRWVPGAPRFRFGAVLVQVSVRSEFIFGSHLVLRLDSKWVQGWSRFGRFGADSVQVLVQTWFRVGSDVAQIWFTFDFGFG